MIKEETNYKINFYNDKSTSLILDGELVNRLSMKGLISKEGRKLVSFCGVIVLQNSINIFLPREVSLENYLFKEKLAMAAELMRGVEKYGKKSKNSIWGDGGGETSINLDSISLFRYLFDDYTKRGLYSQKVQSRNMNNGKPNWKRTVANLHAFPNNSNNFVYIDIYCTKSKYQNLNLIASIQANILQYLDSKFSWLLTGREGKLFPELHSIDKPYGNTAWQILILKREISMLYSEKDVRLVDSLIRFLEKNLGVDATEFYCGLTNFHHAWETMLGSVLSSQITLSSLLPAPVYVKNDGSLQGESRRNMRIDISLEHPEKKHIVIIDAKYYGTSSGEVPGWPDLVKQFYYEKAVSLIYDDEYSFSNVFIFPGKSGPYKYVVMKDRMSEEYFPETFPPVHCVYICPAIVIKHYVRGERIINLEEQLLSANCSSESLF